MKITPFYSLVTALVVLAVTVTPTWAQYPPQMYGPAGYQGGMPPGMPMMAQMGQPMITGMGATPANYIGPPAFSVPVSQASHFSDGGAASCESCGHDKCAGECQSCTDCGWCYKVGVFADFLYLRPRDAEVAFATEVNGPVVSPLNSPPIEVGRVGMTDGAFRAAFRAGFTYVINPDSSITAQYTMFESNEGDSVSATAPNVLYSMVAHPSTFNAGNQMLDAQATHSIDFDLIDVDYRGLIDCSDRYQVNFLVGARYAQLDQSFRSLFSGTGTESIDTNINFSGAGVRGGFEGEWYTHSRRWMAYGKLIGSLVAGEFKADYRQSMSFDPTVVQTSWQAGRIVPIADLEVGFGWQSKCETWRITAGYVFSSWYNVVKTDDWIERVKRSNFVDLGDNMTFDGLVARLEGRF